MVKRTPLSEKLLISFEGGFFTHTFFEGAVFTNVTFYGVSLTNAFFRQVLVYLLMGWTAAFPIKGYTLHQI